MQAAHLDIISKLAQIFPYGIGGNSNTNIVLICAN
ncbi:unnamed protein product, partial [Rotaria sp. Silwood1]